MPEEQVAATLTPVLVYFKQDRLPGETFGDFCARKGPDDLLAWTTSYEADTVITSANGNGHHVGGLVPEVVAE